MKRILSLVLLAVMLVTLCVSFVACGEKAECSLCEEEYPVRKMEKEEIFGEEVYVCEDCMEDLEDLGNLFS